VRFGNLSWTNIKFKNSPTSYWNNICNMLNDKWIWSKWVSHYWHMLPMFNRRSWPFLLYTCLNTFYTKPRHLRLHLNKFWTASPIAQTPMPSLTFGVIHHLWFVIRFFNVDFHHFSINSADSAVTLMSLSINSAFDLIGTSSVINYIQNL
jgi:hypothetical protein